MKSDVHAPERASCPPLRDGFSGLRGNYSKTHLNSLAFRAEMLRIYFSVGNYPERDANGKKKDV